jgi:hypothetical protein
MLGWSFRVQRESTTRKEERRRTATVCVCVRTRVCVHVLVCVCVRMRCEHAAPSSARDTELARHWWLPQKECSPAGEPGPSRMSVKPASPRSRTRRAAAAASRTCARTTARPGQYHRAHSQRHINIKHHY